MSNNKFWMYDVTQLFSSFDLLPNPEDSLAAKLNSITRLTIFICAIIAVYKPIIAFSTLVIVMAITTSLFSAFKQPITENFQEVKFDKLTNNQNTSNSHYMSLLEFMKEYRLAYPTIETSNLSGGFSTTQKRFCNDEVSLKYGPDYFSMNQSLAGGPSMKTTIPPIVVAPSHDLSVWKENDFVIHSNINKETNFDYSRAGYNDGLLPTKCSTCTLPLIETHTSYCDKKHKKNYSDINKKFLKETTKSSVPNAAGTEHRLPELVREMRRNKISESEIQNMLDAKESKAKKKSVTEPTTANSHRVEYFESPRTDNIITQTLQPGVYQKSHVAEPIQSNIGISYTQEFVPTEIDSTSNRIKYTQQNPNNLIITHTLREEVIDQSIENIYDPRFNGYGTSYRSYVDKLTGRPRFYYDDIDSITMPNYITRSNVDTFPWANTYGPDKIMNSDTNNEYRQLANNAFHDSAIQFRTELQERLMRKRNAELWQRRVAPITTMKK
ncbi:MAG: hypothetical protein ACRCZ0_09725 [Cetobacterium sp.]